MKKLSGIFVFLILAALDGAAQVHFEEVAILSGIDHYTYPFPDFLIGSMAGGAAWLDYNNDGWEDLYLTGCVGFDKLYENLGDGNFQDVTIVSGIQAITNGIATTGVSTFDYDQDGFEDILILTDSLQQNLLLKNAGNGSFTDVADQAGLTDISFAASATLGDYDQDGWVDIYVVNWRDGTVGAPWENGYPDRLYHSNGDGTFTDVTQIQQLWSDRGCGLAAAFSDFDVDGDVDLLLANDFGQFQWADENRLDRNDQGVLVEQSEEMKFNIGMNAMCMVGGDFDEDLDLDYYITNIASNVLLRNDVDSFYNVASIAGVESEHNYIDTVAAFNEGGHIEDSWSWGSAFFDYDNDTYLDLFVSNGSYIQHGVFKPDENRLFRNINASGTFQDVSELTTTADSVSNRGCAMADFDHDGDMDLIAVVTDTVGGFARTLLLKNVGGNDQNWLELSLTGTNSNIDAFGTIVYLHFNGRILMRDIDSGGSSYMSHHSKVIHFGLADNEVIDSVVINWPNGLREVIGQLAVNQRVEVVEGQGVLITRIEEDVADQESQILIYPNPSKYNIWVRTNFRTKGYKILDRTGRLVMENYFEGGFSKSNFKLNLTNFSSGVYLLQTFTANGVYTSKIVVTSAQ